MLDNTNNMNNLIIAAFPSFRRGGGGFSTRGEQKLAHERFAALYPDDARATLNSFLAFTGMLGQMRDAENRVVPPPQTTLLY